MKRDDLIITIDGPAGSGKSTIAKMLSERLQGKRLDTGAIYRCIALLAIQSNTLDEDSIAQIAEKTKISFQNERILLNEEDVTEKIRTLKVGEMASKIAAMPKVRKALLPIQRELAYPGPTVCEGRDMGTVVFPDATIKFFLTASAEERAKRRWLELQEKGQKIAFEDVLKAQKERDQRDMNRPIAPLKQPHDAILIDSTGLTPEDVIKIMLSHIYKN